MRWPSTTRLLSQIAGPLAQAADRLAPRRARIDRAWRAGIRRSPLDRRRQEAIWSLSLYQRARELQTSGPRRFQLDVTRRGLTLAKQGIPEDHALGAVVTYLERCLPHLAGDRETLALFALIFQFLLASGYESEHQSIREAWQQGEERIRDRAAQISAFYERDRGKLAQDLHDEVGHDLVVLKLYTQMVAQDLERGRVQRLGKKLQEAVSLIEHALATVRRLAFQLGPPTWEEEGFIPTVKFYVRQFASRTGIRVRVRTAQFCAKLSSAAETALHRVLQGALANVAEHARARNVMITFANRQRSVHLTIEDDGVGFDVERRLRKPRESFGLRAMRERIEALGGSFHIESQRSGRHGTRIEVDLPRPAAA